MTQSNKRLFVALWPDDAARQQVHELRHSMKYDFGLGSVTPVDENNSHITLHFLGSVSEKDSDMLMHALDGVAGNVFDVELDRLGYFSKPKILWLGCSHPPDELIELYKHTQQAIKKCMPGYRSKKYVPHVTLFRKVMSFPDKGHIETIPWHVDSFVLVESKTYPEGVQYRVLQQWHLN